mgnify:CR=1 FL=1
MAGGQLYEGNRFRTSTTQSGRGRVDVSNLANRGVQQQLDNEKAQALVLYQQGLKLSASQNMEELYSQYQDDPQTLSAKLGELSEKMTAEIPDLNTKVAFRTNFVIQSGSLVNRAQANYNKIQYEKKKSSYFDTIQANNKSIATALNNAFNGTGTADDLVNYQTAIKQNIDLINARNDDGTYIFSDAQRLSMSNAVDKLAAQSFSNALGEMDDDKRTQTLQAINNDSMIIMRGEHEGEEKQLNLKDAFSPEVYSDMKKSATILDNKIKKKQLAEWRQNKAYSAMALMQDPSEQNYKIWEYYNQDASDDKKKKMQAIAGYIPDEETITNFEGVEDFAQAIKDLSNYNVENDDDAREFINRATDYTSKAIAANRNRDDDNNPKISSADLKEQQNKMFVLMSDRTIRNLVNRMPDGNWFEKLKATAETGSYRSEGDVSRELSKIGIDTMVNVVNLAFEPLEDGEDSEDRMNKMWRAYSDGKEKAIKAKYWYIPDIQRGLYDGKTYEINGRLYKYNGSFGDSSWELLE